MTYGGLPQQTLDYLDELGAHNDKAWFEAHRDDYDRWYLDAARDLVVAAGERIAGGVVAVLGRGTERLCETLDQAFSHKFA